MYKNTVTVFNYYESPVTGDVTWYPHIIENCDLIVDKASNQEKTGLENADKAKLHVKYATNSEGQIIISNKIYIQPKEWQTLLNDFLPKFITFRDGKDFFAEGAYALNPINDDDYRNGFFDYMNNTKDHVYRITSVGQYSLIPHFEIGGA